MVVYIVVAGSSSTSPYMYNLSHGRNQRWFLPLYSGDEQGREKHGVGIRVEGTGINDMGTGIVVRLF